MARLLSMIQGRNDLSRLFILRAAIREIAHALAPSLVASGFERAAHQRFDMFFADPVFALDIGKADMIRQSHLHDVADMLLREGL